MKHILVKLICLFFGHQWIMWEHGGNRKRKEFVKGKAILKNPECFRCGVRKNN